MNKLLKVIATMKSFGNIEFKVIEFEIKSEGKTIVVFEDEYKNSTKRIKELEVIDTIYTDWYMLSGKHIIYNTWCRPENLESAKEKLKNKCHLKIKELLNICNEFKVSFGAIK